jgi:hypothetical protein
VICQPNDLELTFYINLSLTVGSFVVWRARKNTFNGVAGLKMTQKKKVYFDGWERERERENYFLVERSFQLGRGENEIFFPLQTTPRRLTS